MPTPFVAFYMDGWPPMHHASTRQERARTRELLWDKYDHHYTRADGDVMKCHYCGDPSGCLDHCPPLSWVDVMGIGYFWEEKIPLVKVPACMECNGVLAAHKLFSFEERRQYLEMAMKRRYKRLLKLPAWSESQIVELKGKLKRFVGSGQAKKEWVEQRLEAMKGIADGQTVQTM